MVQTTDLIFCLRTKSYKIEKVGLFILKGTHDQVCLHFFRWICWLCLLFSPARSAKNEREAWKYIKKQTLDRVAPWLCSVLISDGRLGHCQACLAFPDGKGNNESVNSMIELKGLAGPSLKRVNGPLKMDGSSRIGIAAPVS